MPVSSLAFWAYQKVIKNSICKMYTVGYAGNGGGDDDDDCEA